MGSLGLIARSLRYYRRMHAGLFLGTALAAAILTGALAVGASARYSLREQALTRLGSIESAVFAGDRLFSQELGATFKRSEERTKLVGVGESKSSIDERARTHKLRSFLTPLEGGTPVGPVTTALLLSGMAIHQDPATGKSRQLNRVHVLGVQDSFWGFGQGPAIALDKGEIAIDKRVAAALSIRPGDTLALRVQKPSLLVRDAPLSSREEEPVQRANYTVRAVLTDAQLGRFGLSANQAPSYNVFLPLSDLQERVDVTARVNLLLSASEAPLLRDAIAQAWKLEDVGLRLEWRGGSVLQLESDRIFLDSATEKAALALPRAQGSLTYLVNTIRKGERFTPYSFMTAGAHAENLRDDEIVINSWLAEALDANVGDRIAVAYYELLPTNLLAERSREFTVKEVLPVESLTLDKDLVPNFPGLSNVESCRDWKIGMPMDEKLLQDKPNEQYWKDYRQTPKAFVTLAAGQQMWGNRFGRLTGVRFEAIDERTIQESLRKGLDPATLGLDPIPVRQAALRAAAQATDLGGLFLGMSFFLLVSALVLTGLLYGLGVQQRAGELGTLAALGFTPRRIRFLLLGETLAVCIPGAVAGAGLGALYAQALLFALAHYWQDAVGQTTLQYHGDPNNYLQGIAITVFCALATAYLAMRRLLRRPARELLTADFSQDQDYRPGGRRGLAAAILAFAAAIATVAYALLFPPQDVALPFFTSGALILVGGALLSRHVLARAAYRPHAGRPTLLRTALSNASRRRARSMGVIVSLSSGCFLVLAVSSMQRDVGADADLRASGTGGFAFYAESTVPILDPSQLSREVPGLDSIGLRVRDGDDASCLNLGRAQTPRVIGVDIERLAQLGAFAPADLWKSLDANLPGGALPALVGDANTALWGLQKKTGLEQGDLLTYKDDSGLEVKLKLVGQLPPQLSVFQGAILVSNKTFSRLWPSEEGFRAFLIDAPQEGRAQAAQTLETAFDRYGIEVAPATQRLEMFYAVERTYLNMFLALGGLGVLLGAAATGIVVLRNVFERRKEIALLRAIGFPQKTVFRLLLCEYALLLLMGTLTGGAASAVAMAPALASSGAQVHPASRVIVFLLVLAAATLCVWAALTAALRQTNPTTLHPE